MSTKALIVDDELSVCELIQAVLVSAGMTADSMTESSRVMARLNQEKFDAIFLDVRMPVPDGIELAQKIRASGLNKQTPIVMITGDSDPAVLSRGFEAGANFFLFKPIDHRRLLRLMRASQVSFSREKRRFQRVAVHAKVSIEWEHEKLEGTTVDLSLNGALVKVAKALSPGSRVSVRLHLPPGPVQAKGRVARVIDNDCVGIQLEALSPADSQRLQEFLLPLILGKMEPETVPIRRGEFGGFQRDTPGGGFARR